MNLDDIIEMASARTPSHLDRARTRRAAERVLREFAGATAHGHDLVGDLDVEDVLAPHPDPAARILRTAQAAQRGWLRWDADTDTVTWSDTMSKLFGYPAVTTGVDADLLRRTVHPDDITRVGTEVRRAWQDRVPAEFTFQVVRPSGALRYVQCLIEILEDDGRTPTGIIATVQDATERELDRQAHDRHRRRQRLAPSRTTGRGPGDGLLTRKCFLDELDLAVRRSEGALLVIAVEPVGEAGNAPEASLSRAVAHVLHGAVGDGDVCGVLGPYEFAVLIRDAGTAPVVAGTLHQQLGMSTAGGVRLKAWGGLVAILSEGRPSSHDLILDALWAGRQARRKKSPLQILPGPRPPARRDGAIREQVDSAVQGQRLHLYAQPIRDLALNEITRHEILLRVRGAGGLLEPPAGLLAAAERSDDILTVDRWVVDRSLALIGQGPQTSHFQINLSGRTVSAPGTAGFVVAALRRHDVDPRRITFEITESAAINNLTAAARFAKDVGAAGCEIALDDFGTGFSALALIKELPVDLVKIDGSFVTRLGEAPADRIIVRAVAQMCRSLGIRTGAEGVEDPETIGLLRQAGVDFAQGYAIGRPCPMPAPPNATDAGHDRATG